MSFDNSASAVFGSNLADTRTALQYLISFDNAETADALRPLFAAMESWVSTRFAEGSVARSFWNAACVSVGRYYRQVLEATESSIVVEFFSIGVPAFDSAVELSSLDPFEAVVDSFFAADGQPLEDGDVFSVGTRRSTRSHSRGRSSRANSRASSAPAQGDQVVASGGATAVGASPTPRAPSEEPRNAPLQSVVNTSPSSKRLPGSVPAYEDLRRQARQVPAPPRPASEAGPYSFVDSSSRKRAYSPELPFQLPLRTSDAPVLGQTPANGDKYRALALSFVEEQSRQQSSAVPPHLADVYGVAAFFRADEQKSLVKNIASAASHVSMDVKNRIKVIRNEYVDFEEILAYDPSFDSFARLAHSEGILEVGKEVPRRKVADVQAWCHCYDVWANYVLAYYP